jgi:predicted RecA/RadA family phage recombinase
LSESNSKFESAAAAYNVANGEPVECALVGVFELPKAAEAINQGVAVYWDAGAGNVTATATGNSLIGAVTETVGSGAATVPVRLNGIVGVGDHESRIVALENP